MHELSIAQNIVDIVSAEMERSGPGKLVEVGVDIGAISGVDAASLRFVWPMAAKGTIAEGAKLRIHMIEPKAVCNDCKNTFKVGHDFDCPKCHSTSYEILSGRELRVRTMKVE